MNKLAEREGIYISQLPESTSLTDNMLFATDNGTDNNSVSAAKLAEYVNKKIDVAGQVNNGVSKANSYTDTKKTEAVSEANSYTDTKKIEAVSETKEWAQGVFSNPNLLINSNFVKPVNQRGQTSYTANNNTIMCIDRWHLNYANCTAEITNDGLKLTATGGELAMYEYIEEDLVGKAVTISLERLDGYILNATKVITSTNNTISASATGMWITLAYSSGYWRFEIHIAQGYSITVLNAKLEIGEVRTPFVPRPYAEELLLCQRYYQRLSKPGVIFTVFGRTTSTVNITTVIHHYVPLRTNPTITLDSITWRGNGATGTATTFSSQSNDHRQTRFVVNASVQNNMVYALDITNLALDAEIY